MTTSRLISFSAWNWGAIPARTHLKRSWSGSIRVALLLAAFLLLLTLLGMVGSRVHRALPASARTAHAAAPKQVHPDAAAAPCSLPDVRVERSIRLAATLLPLELRAKSALSRICSARA